MNSWIDLLPDSYDHIYSISNDCIRREDAREDASKLGRADLPK